MKSPHELRNILHKHSQLSRHRVLGELFQSPWSKAMLFLLNSSLLSSPEYLAINFQKAPKSHETFSETLIVKFKAQEPRSLPAHFSFPRAQAAPPKTKILAMTFNGLLPLKPKSRRRTKRSLHAEAATYLGLYVSASKDAHGARLQLGVVTFTPSLGPQHASGREELWPSPCQCVSTCPAHFSSG